MNKSADMDSYLAAVPEDARGTLEQLRRTVKATVPDAVETISYGMPTFKYQGKWLFYFGAAKKHCAIYGTPQGTMRFPPDEPPSKATVETLLKQRLAAIEATTAGRSRQKSPA